MRWKVLGTATALLLLLTGCAGTSRAPDPSASARSDASRQRLEGEAGRALDLLPTVWHVHDAAGAVPETDLLFSAGEVEVLEPKGYVLLGWVTQGDAMLTQVDGWAESLGTSRPPTVPWLTSATTFRRTSSGWVLLDVHGDHVADLRDDGPAPTSSTTTTTPRPITASDRERLADAVPGPGTRTVPIAAVSGRWSVPGLDPDHALLTVQPSGRWEVRGGCASGTGQDLEGGGLLRLLPHGLALLTAGAVGGVGCAEPAEKPPADAAALLRFAETRSLTVQDGRMTLYDKRGARIGRLTRIG